jgi:hypothetical protein
MRRYLLFSLLILLYLAGGAGASPSKALATDKSSTIAIVLLGPLEFQHRDYYEIVATTLDKKYGGEKNKLVVGDHPQYMFNRFSDKQGLPPGEIPTDDKLADFAWTHSFDQVIFLLFTAPSVKSNEIALQWENAEVTLTARALTFKSRQKKKHSDVMTSQTVKTITRQAAKAAVFKKCIEALRDQMSIP